MEGTLVETYKGISIKLNSTGWFVAIVEGSEIRNRTLPGLRRKLATFEKPRDVLVNEWYQGLRPLKHIQVVTEPNGRFRDVKTGRLVEKFVTLYEYDSEAERKLIELNNQCCELVHKQNNIIESLRRIR